MFVIQDSAGNYLIQINAGKDGADYLFDTNVEKALRLPESVAMAFISDTKTFPNCEAIPVVDLDLSEVQQLALFLHSFCTSNHTDQCGFGYEFTNNCRHVWTSYHHSTYLKKAQNLRDKLPGSLSQIKEMVKLVRQSL